MAKIHHLASTTARIEWFAKNCWCKTKKALFYSAPFSIDTPPHSILCLCSDLKFLFFLSTFFLFGFSDQFSVALAASIWTLFFNLDLTFHFRCCFSYVQSFLFVHCFSLPLICLSLPSLQTYFNFSAYLSYFKSNFSYLRFCIFLSSSFSCFIDHF